MICARLPSRSNPRRDGAKSPKLRPISRLRASRAFRGRHRIRPLRLCLRDFAVGVERRLLFTFDPFYGVEPYPLPGPVFIHESDCARYPEDGGFPADLLTHALTITAYADGRLLRAEERVEGPAIEESIARLLASLDVDYLHVRDTEAGCYDFRVERTSVE